MKVMTSRPEFDLSFATDFYDWAALDRRAAQVVDVGGAKGHLALALSRRYGRLRLVVQDMASVVDHLSSQDLEPGEDGTGAAGGVRFMPHDLFAPQTVRADAYVFRWIFHNWPDKYCLSILRAQIPVLRPGAKLIVQEAVMPEPGAHLARWRERDFR